MQITFRVTPISLIQKLKYLRKKSKKKHRRRTTNSLEEAELTTSISYTKLPREITDKGSFQYKTNING